MRLKPQLLPDQEIEPDRNHRTIALALVPALLLFLLRLRAVSDVDIFWQLKLGELILAAGHPIASEPFAATHLGEPLPAVAYTQSRVLGSLILVDTATHRTSGAVLVQAP